MFEIIYKPKAIRQLKKIPNNAEIREKCKALRHFPDCQNVKSLTNHQYDYRLRVGRYRVFFNVGSNGEVQIIHIEEVKIRDERTY